MIMSLEQNLPYLSTDLILEIISRLPSKSVARFRCLSKLWASLLTLGSPYFTELFLTQSKTRPRLLFAVQKNDHKWYLYSSQQPQISYTNSKSSSLTVIAEFQMSFPKAWYLQISLPLSSLIYYSRIQNSNGREYPAVCNPSTGQILWLPKLKTRDFISYFGYDPIDKKFRILSISFSLKLGDEFPSNFQIVTLRYGQLFWRNLTCPLQHVPYEFNTYNTCINGVLYYTARLTSASLDKIVCFDFNSEEFKFIDQPWSYYDRIFVVNFKGKLCGITMTWVKFGERYNLELFLWILEDFEKEEWSKHLYRLPSGLCNRKCEETRVYVVGVSVTDDIVLSTYYIKTPFCVYFFNPEKNTCQEVEVKGLEDCKSNNVCSFVNYVEDLRTF